MPPPCMMIIAGEASGDLHGAKLAQAIITHDRDAFLFGIGGRFMQAEGVRLLVDAETLAVVGLTEVVAKLPAIHRALKAVKQALRQIKPDVLILIDFPDFNFLAAAAAKKAGIPVLYYISPQIWAWRQNRVKKIKRLVDHMAVILPFEAGFYRRHGIPVTFVGHPLLDRIRRPSRPPSMQAETAASVVGLLPGSREKEVATLLPVMLAAAKRIQRRLPGVRFLISRSPSVPADLIMNIVGRSGDGLDLRVASGPVEAVFKESRLLVAASGTVTLEAALHGVPAIIVYKVSPVSYWLGKRLIKVKHIGIVNLIVKKALMPELIQDDASPGNIAGMVVRMMTDPHQLGRIETELLQVRRLLGGPGAAERVARIAFMLI